MKQLNLCGCRTSEFNSGTVSSRSWRHTDPLPSSASSLEKGRVAGVPNAPWASIDKLLGGVGESLSSIDNSLVDSVGPTSLEHGRFELE